MTTIGKIQLNWRPRPVHYLALITSFSIIIILSEICITSFTISEFQRQPPRTRLTTYPDYITALRSCADASGFIILAMFDESFVDMAVNMYETSLKRHSINNFLFVGVGSHACPLLHANAWVPCFKYADDEKVSVASKYGTKDFKRKMNIRTRMIIDALNVNLTVLHTDTDVAFVNNPIAELKAILSIAHIAMLWDHKSYNAGFLVVRPTWLTRLIYETMMFFAERMGLDDQASLNKSLRKVKEMYKNRTSSGDSRWSGFSSERVIVRLDRQRFVCGVEYFQKSSSSRAEWSPLDACSNSSTEKRKFRPCADVVHNNWIVGKSAKIFRFREHLMWSYDPDGEYYANRDAKYLTYRYNRPDAGFETQFSELKTALAFGHLLNRTVILKRFRCNETAEVSDCTLSSVLNVDSFESQFAGRYRESTFLVNSRVPIEVRYGLSAVQRCHATNDDGINDGRGNSTTLSSELVNKYRRMTSGEVVRKFSSFVDHVLVFDSFADDACFPSFDDRSDGQLFAMKLQRVFVRRKKD